MKSELEDSHRLTGIQPTMQPRRLRSSSNLRELVSETKIDVGHLVMPIFVQEGERVKSEIQSMPGIHRYSPDKELEKEMETISNLGINSVLLFGLPKRKNASGTEAYSPTGVVQKALESIKNLNQSTVVICDVCMCEYTDHGHCGILREGVVDNAMTIATLGKIAVAQARAGADIVAPSSMMDDQVAAIRSALDSEGFQNVPIMSYSSKFSSAFYGPFREAANSSPQFGDRRTYQMDPRNSREAMREIALDIKQGADIVMVKPALAYLDVISAARRKFNVPLAAYNVSGEYSMVKAASLNGWIDERRAIEEILNSIGRAGADIIISYFAKQYASYSREAKQ